MTDLPCSSVSNTRSTPVRRPTIVPVACNAAPVKSVTRRRRSPLIRCAHADTAAIRITTQIAQLLIQNRDYNMGMNGRKVRLLYCRSHDYLVYESTSEENRDLAAWNIMSALMA